MDDDACEQTAARWAALALLLASLLLSGGAIGLGYARALGATLSWTLWLAAMLAASPGRMPSPTAYELIGPGERSRRILIEFVRREERYYLFLNQFVGTIIQIDKHEHLPYNKLDTYPHIQPIVQADIQPGTLPPTVLGYTFHCLALA